LSQLGGVVARAAPPSSHLGRLCRPKCAARVPEREEEQQSSKPAARMRMLADAPPTFGTLASRGFLPALVLSDLSTPLDINRNRRLHGSLPAQRVQPASLGEYLDTRPPLLLPCIFIKCASAVLHPCRFLSPLFAGSRVERSMQQAMHAGMFARPHLIAIVGRHRLLAIHTLLETWT